MQIHEVTIRQLDEAVFGPGGWADQVKGAAAAYKAGGLKALADPTAQQQAQQDRAAAQAAGAAGAVKQRLDQYTKPQMSFDELFKKTQTDPGTQTYIKGLAQDWKKQQKTPVAEASTDPRIAGGVPQAVANLKANRLARAPKKSAPVATAAPMASAVPATNPTPAPATPATPAAPVARAAAAQSSNPQAITVGGQKINPSDPLYAKLAQQAGLQPQTAAAKGLDDPDTLKRMVPAMAAAAKKTNNSMTPTNLAKTLAAAAPTIWNNTKDKPGAIKAITTSLRKMGVTITGETGTALKQQFQTWSDAYLASRDPSSGTAITMDMVRSDPAVGARLDKAMDALTKAKDTAAWDQAFNNYMNTAIAGIRLKTQELQQKVPASARPVAATARSVGGADPELKTKLDSVGMDERQFNKLGLALGVANKRLRSSGNEQLDNIYRMMGAQVS